MTQNRFYGWINVGLSALIMLLTLGLGNASLSQFLPLIAKDLSVNMSQVTLLVSFSSISIAIFGALIGPAIKKFGHKNLIYIGVLLYSLSILILSFSNSLPLIYLAGVAMGAGISYGTSLTLSTIISAWFIEKRGLALGLVFAASGVGGFIFNPIVARFILAIGYRKTLFIEAITIFIVCIVGAFFIVANPKDKGEKPLGEVGVINKNECAEESLNKTDIYRSLPFILLVFSCISFAMAIQPTMYNFFPHYLSLGYDQIFIANLISIVSLVNIAAKLIMGYVNDKFGLIKAISIGFIGYFVCDLIMIVSNSKTSAYLAVIAYGFALTMLVVALPLIVPKVFGMNHYASILGILTAFLTIGSSIGTPLSSLIFDKTGEFRISFIIQAILIVVSYLLFLRAVTYKSNLIKKGK